MLASRAYERLAYFLLEISEVADAQQAARAAVDVLPESVPGWEYPRALSTHAQTLMYAGDEPAAASRAEQARSAARAADAPWVEADALVTLGLLAERVGRTADAIELFTMAHLQACEAQMLGVELRAAFQLARARLEHGDIADASRDRASRSAARRVGRARPGSLRT